MPAALNIRDMRADEAEPLGRLLIDAYSGLDGFPTLTEQPQYYDLLARVGSFADKPGVRVLVALAGRGELVGGVVYFGQMAEYGSGGIATSLEEASGIRLLAIDARHRGLGAGKALTQACVDLARRAGRAQVVLHTTEAMHVAWRMYEKLGFIRAPELDFLQQSLPVFGFRLQMDWLTRKGRAQARLHGKAA